MKRREFIKSTGIISASAVILPSLGCKFISDSKNPNHYPTFILKEFKEEHEEYPVLVGDGKGEMWMFSLRRLNYPKDTEVVSAFRFDGKSWEETDPVTKREGQYEAPVASCAGGGKPVIAWTEIKGENWDINVASLKGNGFSDPHKFPANSGKSINPVLISPDSKRNWIAWENLHNGKFVIYFSKYENGHWSKPTILDKGKNSCFDPNMAEDANGDLFIAYGITNGFHQDIEMSIIDGKSFEVKEIIPIAVGGGHKNRVNLNTKPALAFDADNRLWISYENNRNVHRLEDGDNYTGDRCCAVLSYEDGKIVEPEKTGKWLFTGLNDHKPTFIKDINDQMYLATHCGGDFIGNPYWKYRLSCLDSQKGWSEPDTILQTSQKGALISPAITFDIENKMWLATCIEKQTKNTKINRTEDVVNLRLSQLTVQQMETPKAGENYTSLNFRESKVIEYLPDENSISQYSGHFKVTSEKITSNGEEYSLVYGNLHEHSEISSCWPAGTDGTLHDDYRFGMFSEGYDFVGITDHGYSMNEVYWRKNIRLVEFYNDPPNFVAIPAMEWTLTTGRDKEIGSVFASGHYNIIFTSPEEADKFIRNKHEIFNVNTPETKNAKLLWELLHEKNIDCITIPHHPADESHPVDWSVYDPKYVPIVEIFQCRGNAEYPGCPREINVERHRPHKSPIGFVDYAFKEKKYKMGFIASGDHNSMGVGAASLWVKELTREGIIEAMRSRRCFATTGDKMIVDFRINGKLAGSTTKIREAPNLNFKVKGQHELEKVEILRNSKVIKEYNLSNGPTEFDDSYIDENYQEENEVLYYYVRGTQKNNEIVWSSPIWIDIV